MSQWTHVNAAIRFDVFLNEGVPTENELGVICSWKDWKETDMPCGSEGGLGYKIVETNQDGSEMYGMSVVFNADLRDYDNVNEILTYFTKVTEGKMIRSGILEIDVEYADTTIYRINDEKWELAATIKYEED